MNMEVFLDLHDLLQAIEGDNVPKKKDRLALLAIFFTVSEDMMIVLDAKKSAKENWDILCS